MHSSSNGETYRQGEVLTDLPNKVPPHAEAELTTTDLGPRPAPSQQIRPNRRTIRNHAS
jgi:hypothetical protein